MLTIDDHRRDKMGLTYVYPVLSRRAGGLSIGINLNTNNTCNWRCIYCQVPGLHQGQPPPIDLDKLTDELRYCLTQIIDGDFYEQQAVPEAMRKIRDIAISGNGEPTMIHTFENVVDRIKIVMTEFQLLGRINTVLITNGSRMAQETVQAGVKKIAALNGAIWFKIDSATVSGRANINNNHSSTAALLKRLSISSALCATWIQTCFFAVDANAPRPTETAAYIAMLEKIRAQKIPIQGILLYGIARPSLQAEASRLSALPIAWMQQFAAQINAHKFKVALFP